MELLFFSYHVGGTTGSYLRGRMTARLLFLPLLTSLPPPARTAKCQECKPIWFASFTHGSLWGGYIVIGLPRMPTFQETTPISFGKRELLIKRSSMEQ